MDITPQASATQPISDDQELAKALAGVMPDQPETPAVDLAAAPQPAPALPPLQFEEAPAPTPAAPGLGGPAPATPAVPSELDRIKSNAIGDLRPLIDKVELPAEEKFDTYLMLIRSTDDQALIAPAYAAAQSITDEKRRAEALLDIIKEIDYLSRNTQAQ